MILAQMQRYKKNIILWLYSTSLHKSSVYYLIKRPQWALRLIEMTPEQNVLQPYKCAMKEKRKRKYFS